MIKNRAVVVLGGEPLDNFSFCDTDFIIACDVGFAYLQKRGVTPNVTLGDFDSLGFIPENAQVYPVDKDYTDGELGLLYAVSKGYKKIDFICAGGGRDDQFFANVTLLMKAGELGVLATIHTNSGKIFYCNDEFKAFCVKDKIISLCALNDSLILSSHGLKYQYDNTTLKRGSTLGVSNVAIDDAVTIKISSGEVLIFINN